jgi:hypothetical protein
MWSENLKERDHFGSFTGRWKDNIKIDLSETGCESVEVDYTGSS